jgi:hypothetical protein
VASLADYYGAKKVWRAPLHINQRTERNRLMDEMCRSASSLADAVGLFCLETGLQTEGSRTILQRRMRFLPLAERPAWFKAKGRKPGAPAYVSTLELKAAAFIASAVPARSCVTSGIALAALRRYGYGKTAADLLGLDAELLKVIHAHFRQGGFI